MHRLGREIGVDACDCAGVRDGIALHAEDSTDEVAGVKARVSRLDHASYGARAHDFADLDGRDV